MTCRLDPHQFRLYRPGDDGPAWLGQHIHFAAHSELREIDSRFNGEASVRQNQTIVVSFQIVQIRPITMSFSRNAMPSPVSEVFSQPGTTNNAAGRIIGLPTCNRPAGSESLLNNLDRRIPRLRDQGEYLPFAVARLAANYAGPGDVIRSRSPGGPCVPKYR